MKTTFHIVLVLLFAVVFTNCNTTKPTKSVENLLTAYKCESSAAQRYSLYTVAARKEGFDTIAALFEAASKSENIHALNHRKALEKLGVMVGLPETETFAVKTTAENLQAAIDAEIHDFQTMYPVFIREAESEKVPDAAKSFSWAWNAERKHLNAYRQALVALSQQNEKGLPDSWLICPACGNTYSYLNVKQTCDFCLMGQEAFTGYSAKLD